MIQTSNCRYDSSICLQLGAVWMDSWTKSFTGFKYNMFNLTCRKRHSHPRWWSGWERSGRCGSRSVPPLTTGWRNTPTPPAQWSPVKKTATDVFCLTHGHWLNSGQGVMTKWHNDNYVTWLQPVTLSRRIQSLKKCKIQRQEVVFFTVQKWNNQLEFSSFIKSPSLPRLLLLCISSHWICFVKGQLIHLII